jgi:acetyl esterase
MAWDGPFRRPRAQRLALRAIGALPARLARALGGTGRECEGARLEPDLELLLRLLDRFGWPDFADLDPAAARAEIEREADVFRSSWIILPPAGRSRTVALPGGHARLHVPPGAAPGGPLLVWFHGGGFVFGWPAGQDGLCRHLARRAGVRVLAPQYRLAPEHRFPAAVDDALAAHAWARAHAEELGADPERVGVGGDSAGGCLAAVVAREASPRPRLQLLLYPITDLARESGSYATHAEAPMLTRRQMRWFRGHYLASEADARDPRASPLLATDLAGLPPALVAVAGFDPLRDEGLAYARALRGAGSPATVAYHPGQLHAFAELAGASRSARAALDEVCVWLVARA